MVILVGPINGTLQSKQCYLNQGMMQILDRSIIFNKKEQTPYIASIGKVEFRATLPNKCHGIILILELYEKYKDAMHLQFA